MIKRKKLEIIDDDVTNIVGTSGMTRSGRICTPKFNVTNEASRGPTKEVMLVVLNKKPKVVKPDEVVGFL